MSRGSDVRDRLLETASELIGESSYGAVSVDDICARAKVLKGSFYHFFPSKSDLAVAAIEAHWERNRPDKDRAFSPQVPPLERLVAWCDMIRRNQSSRREKKGKVLGCPYSSMGSELSTLDEKIRLKCQEMTERTCRYVAAALRDAQREGLIAKEDPESKARELYSYVMGTILQAKIQNDLAVLERLERGVFRLLGVRVPARRKELTK
jgi:TetR/AcrR family transcriptional repressor of nem operon